jgi:hypothetical protein
MKRRVPELPASWQEIQAGLLMSARSQPPENIEGMLENLKEGNFMMRW